MQHPQMLQEKFDHFHIRANNTQNVATGWLNARNMLGYVALRMTRTIAFSRPVSYRTADATEGERLDPCANADALFLFSSH